MAVPPVLTTQGLVGRGYSVQAANMNNYVTPGSWVHAVPGPYILQHAVSLTLTFPSFTLVKNYVCDEKLIFFFWVAKNLFREEE